jgi:hypothetical protein
MVVGGYVSIVSHEVTAIDLDGLPLSLEQVQVPVDGPQADPGKPLPHQGVKLIGSRMRFKPPQLLQDDLSLPGAPLSGTPAKARRIHYAPK